MALPPLYLDEDSCGRRLVAALRRLGFDVLTVDEAKTRRWSDEQQLVFATGTGRVLVSANVGDFARLQQAWGEAGHHHRGIVIWKRDRWSPERFAEHFASEVERFSDTLENAILYF